MCKLSNFFKKKATAKFTVASILINYFRYIFFTFPEPATDESILGFPL